MLTHHLPIAKSLNTDFLQLPTFQVNHLPFDSIFLDLYAYLELRIT